MAEQMIEAVLFFIGVWIGGVANAVWYSFFDKYSFGLEIFEHYHWATVLTILGFRLSQPILLGIALVWLLDEAIGQRNKFAIGSGHFKASALVEVLILALWILVELLLKLLFH
ncbi:MAG: hypothetical protein QXT92_00410 [Nitrososphaerota archaeon]